MPIVDDEVYGGIKYVPPRSLRWSVPLLGIDYMGWVGTNARPGTREGRADVEVANCNGDVLFVIDQHGRCWRGGKPVDPADSDAYGRRGRDYELVPVRTYRGFGGHSVTVFRCGRGDTVRRVVDRRGCQWWEPCEE